MALHLNRGSVDLDFIAQDLRQALSELFQVMDVGYVLPPEVQGTVTLHLHNASYQDALHALLGRFFTYHIDEHNVIHVYRCGTTWRPGNEHVA